MSKESSHWIYSFPENNKIIFLSNQLQNLQIFKEIFFLNKLLNLTIKLNHTFVHEKVVTRAIRGTIANVIRANKVLRIAVTLSWPGIKAVESLLFKLSVLF